MSNIFPNQETTLLAYEDFSYFKARIYSLAGISLNDKKIELVQTRLRNKLTHLNFTSFKDYRKLIESLPDNSTEIQDFINLMTTNKTDFFREPKHFDFMEKNLIPEWKKKAIFKPLIWSAACSTGEEAYTLSMILDSLLKPTQDYLIHATDIDSSVLENAKNGVYPKEKLNLEVPTSFSNRYIEYGTNEIKNWGRIKPFIKERVKFYQHNLVDQHAIEGKFDAIFLRNVLIYFSKESTAHVVEKLFKAANPGAMLFISHTETLNGIPTSWKLVLPSIYIKK